MFIPSGFLPSEVTRKTFYDEEGRLKSFNVSRESEGGISESNSLFATESEQFGSCAPFLKRAKVKDAKRRNYVVQPGGAIIYFEGGAPPELPSRTEFPSDRTTFGHDTLDATSMVNGGVAFTTGTPSPRNG